MVSYFYRLTMRSLIITFDETKAHQVWVKMSPRQSGLTQKTSAKVSKVECILVAKRLFEHAIVNVVSKGKAAAFIRPSKPEALSESQPMPWLSKYKEHTFGVHF